MQDLWNHLIIRMAPRYLLQKEVTSYQEGRAGAFTNWITSEQFIRAGFKPKSRKKKVAHIVKNYVPDPQPT